MRATMTGFMAVIAMSPGYVAADDGWRTEPPITYVLDYGREHLGYPEYIEAVAGSPPVPSHIRRMGCNFVSDDTHTHIFFIRQT